MTKKKITIDKNFVLSSAYEEYKYLLDFMNCKGNYNQPGISDYPFYAYYSTLVDNTTILEIGTCEGGSATMMSHNQTNKIISYDVVKHDIVPDRSLRGIDFRIGNFMEDEIDYDEIDLIAIDAAHNGTEEIEMVKHLNKNWKGGLLFLDDINLNQMRGFWESIDRDMHEVFDISDIAHGYHGSGLVNFNRYFDLTVIG
jgi:hypothetical protein